MHIKKLALLFFALCMLCSSYILHAQQPSLTKGVVCGTVAGAVHRALRHQNFSHWTSRQRIGVGIGGTLAAFYAYKNISNCPQAQRARTKLSERYYEFVLRARTQSYGDFVTDALDLYKTLYNGWSIGGNKIAGLCVAAQYFPSVKMPQGIFSSPALTQAAGIALGSLLTNAANIALNNYSLVNSGALLPVSTAGKNFISLGGAHAMPETIQTMAACLKKGMHPGGILEFGPPGTGKTLYVQALAGETQTPLFELKIADLMRQNRERSFDFMTSIFAAAQAAALLSPTGHAILFCDEIDTLASDRARATTQETAVLAGVFNLLIGYPLFKNVVVIGATNHIDRIDAAIKRPGRLTPVLIDSPTILQLKNVYETALATWAKTAASITFEKNIDCEKLAKFSAYQPCAFADHVIKKAVQKNILTRSNESFPPKISEQDITDEILIMLQHKTDEENFSEQAREERRSTEVKARVSAINELRQNRIRRIATAS